MNLAHWSQVGTSKTYYLIINLSIDNLLRFYCTQFIKYLGMEGLSHLITLDTITYISFIKN